jgi:cellulose synthase/poly-beta-1,6-N-acetylglucosamine synthase-like glycosyltransferase
MGNLPLNPIPNPSWLTLIVLSIVARIRGEKREDREPSEKHELPSYSVLIPAHNEDSVIRQALSSCSAQTVKPERVVILDDASHCDYRSIVESTYPDAEIVRTETRRGKAFNVGMFSKELHSDFVLVLDADSYVEPDYVEKILSSAPFDVAFGTVMPDEESSKAIYGRQRLVEYTFGQVVWKRAFNLMGAPNITGCFAVYRTGLLRDLGFPARTETEDLDLCWTILEKNGKILYVPEARGFTKEPGSFPEYHAQVKRWYQGFWQCVKSHGAKGVGDSDKLTLSLNFILLDQLILAPIWLAFLLGSILLGVSHVPALTPYFHELASNGVFGGFLSAWHRWFPFAASPILAVSSMTFDVIVTSALTLSWTRAQGKTRQAAKALPLFYLISWYNRLVFWASGIKTILWHPTDRGSIW